jgi:hypothetical protein
MSKVFWLVCLAFIAAPLFAASSPLQLMLEGRYGEAKSIMDATNAPPRYQLLYYAMTEAEAARACSLYQVIAIRYPDSDCDSVARARLDQARDMGFNIVPISEWSQAEANVRPLSVRKIASAPPPPPLEPVTPAPAPVAIAPAPVVTTPAEPQAPPPQSAPEPVAVAQPVEPPPPEPAKPVEAAPAPEKVPEQEPAAVTDTTEKAPEPETKAAPEPEPIPEPQAEATPPEPPAPLPPAPKTPIEVPQPAATNVQPPVETAPAKEPAATTGHWYIQVGAFGNFDNAHKLALAIEKAGYSIKLVPRETKTAKLLQVRVGGYPTKAACSPVAEQLKEKFNCPAVVVSE